MPVPDSHRDKPFRAPVSHDPEDHRLAFERLNRRFEAALLRIKHLERLLTDNNLWTDPT